MCTLSLSLSLSPSLLTSSHIGGSEEGWTTGRSRVGTVKSTIVKPPLFDCSREEGKEGVSEWGREGGREREQLKYIVATACAKHRETRNSSCKQERTQTHHSYTSEDILLLSQTHHFALVLLNCLSGRCVVVVWLWQVRTAPKPHWKLGGNAHFTGRILPCTLGLWCLQESWLIYGYRRSTYTRVLRHDFRNSHAGYINCTCSCVAYRKLKLYCDTQQESIITVTCTVTRDQLTASRSWWFTGWCGYAVFHSDCESKWPVKKRNERSITLCNSYNKSN